MSRQDVFDRILASLYEAALDDSRWPAASALIGEACESRRNALVVGKGASVEHGQIFWTRFCHDGEHEEDRERWYFDNYYLLDERLPRAAQLPDSRLVRISDLYTPQERRTSPAYNEALPGIGYPDGLNVRLDGPDGSGIYWALSEPADTRGWHSRQTRVVKRLLPHIRQFIVVRHELAKANAVGASLTALLDNLLVGVIQLDERGRIVTMNDRAGRFLRGRRGLSDQKGYLRASVPADNACLERLLARALPALGDRAVGGSMAVRRSPGLSGLVVHVNPVKNDGMELNMRRVGAVVLVVEPGRWSRIPPDLAAASLGLTPAESRVATSLAAGQSVSEIASTTGRQENSVRFLLKGIYRKLGISRQSELVRLVLSLGRF